MRKRPARVPSPTWLLLLASMALALHLPAQKKPNAHMYAGFDSNEYPGDANLSALHEHFAFLGYWLTNPPGSHRNDWLGKRDTLRQHGFGFLVLANGRLDKELKANPASLGQKDAAAAIATATREHFPAHTILFLDQEEGGRMTPPQMAYLLAWTETVAASPFRPGVYLSGQPVPDGPGQTLTTAQNLRDEIAARHLHDVALWVYQDACPPAPGCSLPPPPLSSSGTPGAIVWQYAQSPRRRALTTACAKTYAPDGECHPAGLPVLSLDLNVAASSDPSGGR